VALVNTDTLPERGWLSSLVAAADGHPSIGSVASRMLFMDRPEVVQSAGIALDPAGIAWDRLGGASADEAAVPAGVFGASAGAALYRRAALDDVAEDGHVFDPRFFMYLEDVDICRRAREQLGEPVLYLPHLKAVHLCRQANKRLFSRHFYWFMVSMLKYFLRSGSRKLGLRT
jgi:GT2 family glycosyltransferase